MPAAAFKKSASSLPPRKSTKPGYDRAKGRPISLLLKQKIERERKAGLILTVPDGVPRMPIPVAAAKYSLSPETLRKWISAGRLKYVRFGRQLRVTDNDIIVAASSTYGDIAASGEVA